MSEIELDDPHRLLLDLRSLIRLHRDFGIRDYPKTPAVEQFLAPAPPPESTPERPKTARATVATNTHAPTTAPPPPSCPPQRATLAEIAAELGDCRRCPLHGSRERLLFGSGSATATLFIVGDFPTQDDEAAQTPFGGPAGELLDRMLKAIGLERSAVYVTNTVKCRTADNGPPQQQQVATCLPFLLRQIDAVHPKVICAMGPLAAQTLLKDKTPLTRLRGHFHDHHSIPLMPTFHPSFLLKNPDMKKAAWIDLQLIQAKLGC